jgi:hypothetical protein
MYDLLDKTIEKRIDFVVRESRWMHAHDDAPCEADVDEALLAIERAEGMTVAERRAVAGWAARRMLDGFRARAFAIREADGEVLCAREYLLRERVLGVFVDCARILSAGSKRWSRALDIFGGFLVSVRDPLTVSALAGTETALKFVESSVSRVRRYHGHRYLLLRFRERFP